MVATATASASAIGPRYAPEDPTLPKPWRGLVDGKTGYLYFWNPDTNVTQYERPAALHAGSVPANKSVLVSINSSVQVQQSSQGRCENNSIDDDNRYSKGSYGGSKLGHGTKSYQSTRDLPDHANSISNGASSGRGYMSASAGNGSSAESYRRRHEITVTGDNVPPPFTSFDATGLPSEILREVHLAGFSAPTPIQAQSWPIALQSRDIVAIAKTGSGKTLGYLIPGFMHLKRCRNNPRLGPTVLVLSPTRELATQIHNEAVKFGKSSKLSCTCLYGGAPKGPQLRDLDRGADIVVATPGRLNDILEMRRVSLSQVSYLVLDEADRMLDMGFEPQIRKIVNEVPARRQTLMYTATWPKEVRKIAADLLLNPAQVNIGNVDELVANKSITQHIEILASVEKHRRLEQILRSQDPGSKIIVFCSTKKMCDQLARNLSRQFGAAAIHGDKSQGERDHVLNQFRIGKSPILVATDVAARGLDIKDIRMVINYDFPTGVEDYVHRIGRTGRAGATGVAYTFFSDQDSKHASDLIKVLEGANQRVSDELRDIASRGGGAFGRSRRQWGSGPGGRDGGRGGRYDSGYGRSDGNRGGRYGSGYGGTDGGRGGRYDTGYSVRNGGRGGGWGNRSPTEKGGSRDVDPTEKGGGRDVDRNRYGRAAHDVDAPGSYHARSFHESMVRATEKCSSRSRSRSPMGGSGWVERRDRSRSIDRAPPARERSPVRNFHSNMMEKTRSPLPRNEHTSPPPGREKNGGLTSRSRAYFGGEEEEEGMIPADEEGMIPQDEGGNI